MTSFAEPKQTIMKEGITEFRQSTTKIMLLLFQVV